ncbi:hypothetical protein BgiMline_008457 [Biomphalaria glabrata]
MMRLIDSLIPKMMRLIDSLIPKMMRLIDSLIPKMMRLIDSLIPKMMRLIDSLIPKMMRLRLTVTLTIFILACAVFPVSYMVQTFHVPMLVMVPWFNRWSSAYGLPDGSGFHRNAS